MESEKWDTTSLPDNFGYHKQADNFASQHTKSQDQKIQGLGLPTCENSTRNIPASFLVKFLCFGWLFWNFSYWNVYSKAWSCNLPLCIVFFTCNIKDLALHWTQNGLDSWFGLCNGVLLICEKARDFFHLWKELSFQVPDHFRKYHDQK